MDTIITQMKQLGLTEYEVKAYLALLESYPLNGYTLSKNSGIPRSRIYEVLDSLKRKQIVFEKETVKSTEYSPLEPKLLMEKLRHGFDAVIESVDSYTMKLFNKDNEDLEPRTLVGRHEILTMIQVLLKGSKKRVVLSIWDEELSYIKASLEDLQKKDIMLRGVYFGHSNPFDNLVSHRRVERYIAEKNERYIIVVIDNLHVISGIISRGEKSQATWSKDPGIIEISDDFIAHDVMLNMYHNLLEDTQRALYERTLDEVRKNYYGFSDEEFELFPLPEGYKE